MAQVPLHVEPTMFPAVLGQAMGKAKLLLTAPRMQKLAFTVRSRNDVRVTRPMKNGPILAIRSDLVQRA
jgi:hypothetical protein